MELRCAKCGELVEMKDGKLVRKCEHNSATVTASVAATVYGKSKVN